MQHRRKFQWLTVAAAIIFFIVIIFVVREQILAQMNRPAPIKAVESQHPDVSVVTVKTGSYQARISAYGEARPHFELTLTAQVAGQVDSLDTHFEPGLRLNKGQLLVQLEDSDYRAAVAAARKDLQDALLALAEERRQATQAETEWRASGLVGKPDSDLVLRKPQLAVAGAAVANAEAALASARKNLQQTRITTPFACLVVARQVSPGSYLQAGGEVATLYSTDRMEIALNLSARDWAKLPTNDKLASGQWPASLSNVENGRTWQGRVLRSEQHLDGTTRKRTLIIAVDQALDIEQPLLPGMFLQAEIGGREVDGIWKLPYSALSQKGEIWYVNADNSLSSMSREALFSDAEAIYVKAPQDLAETQQKILIHPLSSYLQGMFVNPVEEMGHE